jgi:phospholipid N-methyltransferase
MTKNQPVVKNKKKNLRGLLLFFREIFSSPITIGAAYPSSRKLADAIARQVPLGTVGSILELGPGTGVITKALLEYGIHPENLILIEKSKAFVQHLQENFPKITVIKGDAQNLTQLLGDATPVPIVISSLPLKALPKSTVKNILGAVEKVLLDGGLFIQFTYYHGKNKLPLSDNFKYLRSKYVFLNFPPARIDIFLYHASSKNVGVS